MGKLYISTLPYNQQGILLFMKNRFIIRNLYLHSSIRIKSYELNKHLQTCHPKMALANYVTFELFFLNNILFFFF